MYKVLKVDGSTIYLGGANKEIIGSSRIFVGLKSK